MTGKIIVIEGVDSVGKHTQALELEKKLISDGHKVYLHSFPSYESDTSALVKLYLSGGLGEDVNCVNYKTASSFYAVDRIATYHLLLKKKLENGYIVILDRYTTANMVHQAGKFRLKKDILKAAKWIDNYEFNDLGLPRPNVVIYLSLDKSVREKLLDQRRSDSEKDIYEKDKNYLTQASKAGLIVCNEYKWNYVNCSTSGNMDSIEEISERIYNIVKKSI